MDIADLQQALHSVALKGSLDSFRYKMADTTSSLVHPTANVVLIPTKEYGLQLTLF